MTTPTIVVVGGGAAGFFGSIHAAQTNPSAKVILFEKSKQLLTKVRISGGGRCNVTHACFEPHKLIQNYPRGGKALLGPFSRFQPLDTIEWFQNRHVLLKTEDDGRMFPITDSSETIANCLLNEAKRYSVEIRTGVGLEELSTKPKGFELHLNNHEIISCDYLLLASGSNSKIWKLLENLGHTIIPPVPSLFTFNIPTSSLTELAGITVDKVHVKIKGTSLEQRGPLLITHWGFSGPSILKLSAWSARYLHEQNYRAIVQLNWLPDHSMNEVLEALQDCKNQHPAKLVHSECPFTLPRNLWKKLLERACVTPTLRWSHLSKPLLQRIGTELTCGEYQIEGKTTYKEEFVTCGGVALNEIHFKTMESKLLPGLYFAGEILDIDGVTGGFNFQNAWTTAFIAASSMSEK